MKTPRLLNSSKIRQILFVALLALVPMLGGGCVSLITFVEVTNNAERIGSPSVGVDDAIRLNDGTVLLKERDVWHVCTQNPAINCTQNEAGSHQASNIKGLPPDFYVTLAQNRNLPLCVDDIKECVRDKRLSTEVVYKKLARNDPKFIKILNQHYDASLKESLVMNEFLFHSPPEFVLYPRPTQGTRGLSAERVLIDGKKVHVSRYLLPNEYYNMSNKLRRGAAYGSLVLILPVTVAIDVAILPVSLLFLYNMLHYRPVSSR